MTPSMRRCLDAGPSRQEKVIVENKLVGGGFGGKEDVTVQHHAALVAYLTKRIGEGEADHGRRAS